jgi:hypothetical protein
MKRKTFSIFLILLSVICVSAQEIEAYKFTELSSLWRSETLREVDRFLFELIDNPQAKGFVIFYEGKYACNSEKTKMLLPRYGETACRVQAVRNHIKLRRTFPIDRILFIDGGFREEQTIEFWIVPKQAELPKPGPTLDNMQYRKGKPFCNYQDFY